MPHLALQRARKLLENRPGAAIGARTWGVLHALTLLAILAWAGLFLDLVLSRGIARIDREDLIRAKAEAEAPPAEPIGDLSAESDDFATEPGDPASPSATAPKSEADVRRTALPAWIVRKAPARPEADVILTDTGLYPIVSRNLGSRNPAHDLGARAVLAAMRAVPSLRNDRGALASLLIVGLGLALAAVLVDRLHLGSVVEAAEQAAVGLRRQVHRQVYRLGQSALPSEGIGPVINLFTREVNDVRDGLADELDQVPKTPVLALGLLAMAMLVSWSSALFLGSLGLLVWVTVRALERRARAGADRADRDAALQLCLLHEDLGLLRTVRVYQMEEWDNRRFDEHLEAYREADTDQQRASRGASPTAAVLVAVAAILAVGLLGYNGLRGLIAPGAAIVLTATLALLWRRPLTDWVALGRSTRQANRSAAALFEFLDRRPELLQAGGAQFLPPLRDRIQFEGVTLRSQSGRVLLEDVTVEIPARSRTAIMGPDEDAKHALACLIPRLIDPDEGRVRIDGIDLADVTLESLRAQVAIILQADLVFSDTVVANVGLGEPGIGLPRIIEAAKMAHAHHAIQDLPQGYDTAIGPMGYYLRPDEQFRIALARAFLHDPTIVIIEEPNAPVDEETRLLLDDSLTRLAVGRTLIFLPHRLSTLRSCDRVIVLQDGRIESMGPPAELAGSSNLFRHLRYVQFNQFATGEIEAGQMNG